MAWWPSRRHTASGGAQRAAVVATVTSSSVAWSMRVRMSALSAFSTVTCQGWQGGVMRALGRSTAGEWLGGQRAPAHWCAPLSARTHTCCTQTLAASEMAIAL